MRLGEAAIRLIL